MATKIVSPVREVPFLSPITRKVREINLPPEIEKERITQTKLTAIIGLRNTIAALKADLEQAEAKVKTALESGAEVESGLHRASLKECFRRNVQWREVCERLASRLYNGKGAAYCENVLQNTHPTKTVSLVVS